MPQIEVTADEVRLLLEIERAAQPVAAASSEVALFLSVTGEPIPPEVVRLIEAVGKLRVFREGEVRLRELREKDKSYES